MTAEPYSVSLVSSLAIKVPELKPQGYFRSKLFIAPYTSNPLVAASGPLFSLLERLCLSPSLPSIELIHEDIKHELQAFHSQLEVSNLSSELIALAYYLLAATTDELLGKSYLRLNEDHAEFKAFTPLTLDGAEPQKRFFDIVQHIKDRPNQCLDLIELSYFCLITGFEGEQHLRADGRQNLDNLIEELYLLIQKFRVNKPLKLNHEPAHNPPMQSNRSQNRNPYIVATLLTVSVLFSTLWLSYTWLDNKTKNMMVNHFQKQTQDN